VAAFCQLALERTEAEVKFPAWHQREHSAYGVAMMARISSNWWYNIST
jgi:hypothetical protein